MSDVEGRLKITWPNTLALAKLADAMDFEAIVPVARWRGFGGATNFNGTCYEAVAAGMGALDAPRPAVFCTTHVREQSTRSSPPSNARPSII